MGFDADGRVAIGTSGGRMPLLSFGTGNATAWLQAGGRAIDSTFERNAKHARAPPHGYDSLMQTLDALPRLGLSREDLFITSKVMCLPSAFNAPKHVTSPANQPYADALSDIATSRVGYLDLLLLWWPCSTLQQTVAAYRQLEPLVAEGKVRALGVANFNGSALSALVSEVSVKPAVNQCGLSIAGHRYEEWGSDLSTVQRCRELGVTFQAYSPLGGTTRVLESIHGSAAVQTAATRHKATAAQVAVAWLVQQGIPIVTSSSSPSHMREALDVTGGTIALDEAEMKSLTDVPDRCDKREGNNHCGGDGGGTGGGAGASTAHGSSVSQPRLRMVCGGSEPPSVTTTALAMTRLWGSPAAARVASAAQPTAELANKPSILSAPRFGSSNLSSELELVNIGETCLAWDVPLRQLGPRGMLAHYPCMCPIGAGEPVRQSLRHWIGTWVGHHSSDAEITSHHRWLQLELNRAQTIVRRNRCGELERQLLHSMMHGLSIWRLARVPANSTTAGGGDAQIWPLSRRLCNLTHMVQQRYAEVVYVECIHGVGHGVFSYVAATSARDPPYHPPPMGFRACRPTRPHAFVLSEPDRRRVDTLCGNAPHRELAFKCSAGAYHSVFKGLPVGWRSPEHVCVQTDLHLAAGCYLHHFSPEGLAEGAPIDICNGPVVSELGEANRLGCIFGFAAQFNPYRGTPVNAAACKQFGQPTDAGERDEMLRSRTLACMLGMKYRSQQALVDQPCTANISACMPLQAHLGYNLGSFTQLSRLADHT